MSGNGRVGFLAGLPRLVGNSAASIFIRGSGAVLGFGFNVLLSRTLGPSGTGIVLFYLNLGGMIGTIATCGMDTVGLRELSRDISDSRIAILRQVFANAFLGVALFSLGLALFLIVFGRTLPAGDDREIYLLSVLMLFFAAFQKILSDWLIAFQQYLASQLTFYAIGRTVAVAVAGGGLLWLQLSAIAWQHFFVAAYVFGSVVAVLFALSRLYAQISTAGLAGKLSWSLFRDGIHFSLQSLAFVVLSLSPFFLLAWLSTSKELGLFGVSQRLATFLVLVVSTISQLVMRDLSLHYGQRNFSALAHALTTSVRLTFASAIALTLPLVALAPLWVLIFGGGFQGAAPTLVLLSLGVCGQCLGMPFQAALFATNNERQARNVTFVCAVLGMAICAASIPRYGALGAAAGFGLALILQSIGHGVYVFKKLPLDLNLRTLRFTAQIDPTGAPAARL